MLIVYEAHLEVPGQTFMQQSSWHTHLLLAIYINECILGKPKQAPLRGYTM